jgi:hypothetical protein
MQITLAKALLPGVDGASDFEVFFSFSVIAVISVLYQGSRFRGSPLRSDMNPLTFALFAPFCGHINFQSSIQAYPGYSPHLTL